MTAATKTLNIFGTAEMFSRDKNMNCVFGTAEFQPRQKRAVYVFGTAAAATKQARQKRIYIYIFFGAPENPVTDGYTTRALKRRPCGVSHHPVTKEKKARVVQTSLHVRRTI